MALRAGLRTCGAPLPRPPARLDLGSPARPAAPSGSRRPEPARAGVSARPARNSRRLAEAEQGRTATRRLSPCSRLRAFISSAPALPAVPASALPPTARRAQAPLAAQRFPRARRPSGSGWSRWPGALGPRAPEAPLQPSAVTRTVPVGRFSLGRRGLGPGVGTIQNDSQWPESPDPPPHSTHVQLRPSWLEQLSLCSPSCDGAAPPGGCQLFRVPDCATGGHAG